MLTMSETVLVDAVGNAAPAIFLARPPQSAPICRVSIAMFDGSGGEQNPVGRRGQYQLPLRLARMNGREYVALADAWAAATNRMNEAGSKQPKGSGVVSVSILIACDHGLVRHALVSLLRRQPGVDVARETNLTAALGREARDSGANIVLMTVENADVAVSPLLRTVYRDLAEIPVVLLNLADDDERLLDALSLGVRGIIDKNADGARLTDSIREVLNGEITISKRLASRLVVEFVSAKRDKPRRMGANGARMADVSERELEVLSRLARGESNRVIAERMFISIHTVRAHVRSLMQKLQVQNRVQAATYALKHGLIAPPPANATTRKDAAKAAAGGRS